MLTIPKARSLFGFCLIGLLAGCFSDPPATGTAGGGDDPVAPNSGTKDPEPAKGDGTGTGGTAPAPAANLEVVDDMEGGTGSILPKAGRLGAWYTYNDATAGAKQTPGVPFEPSALAPTRGESAFAAHMAGSGFTTWGAGMGFNFNDPGDGKGGTAKLAYDASAYAGIAFWAKAGAGSTTSLRVNISDKDTDPAGAVCPAAKCSDHFGKNLNITTDWALYTLKFADLTQLGWGQAVPKFDPAAVYAVQFQVAKGTTFDIRIDDVALLVK